MFVKMGSIIVNTERVTHLTTIPSGNKYEGVFPVGSSFKVAFWELWKKLYGYNTKWAWVIEFKRVDE